MARHKTEDDEQANMFPDLNDSEEHKAILKEAKKLIKLRDARKLALTDSKAKEDEIQKGLVEKMKKAGVQKFIHNGVKVEIVSSSEKVKAKLEADTDDEATEEEQE